MILVVILAAGAAGGYTTYATGNFFMGCGVGFVVGLLTLWIWYSADE